MSSRLIDCLATTDALADLFSDQSVLRVMLEFEAALARAAGRAGAIPDSAARTIAGIATAETFDPAAIAREARSSATPIIPLVNALTERVRAVDPASAQFVHWGATSQDVSDTAMILLLKRAKPILAADHLRLDASLRTLSESHADTMMIGRTLLQPASPITFGLKAAGWWAAANRSWRRLSLAWDGALVLQFGGAAGTRAALGQYALDVAAELAKELELASAPPWHADRDRLGAFITASALFTASLGKMARDIALLMQDEVGEVAEAGGGSSTMPQKRNPSACTLVISTAMRMPGLVSTFLVGMLQEHERSVGGGQAEWPTLASAVQATGSAASAMAAVLDGLTVDPARMRSNLEATNGLICAERAVIVLAAEMDRETARSLVTDAIRRSRETGRTLGDVLRSMPEVVTAVPAGILASIDRPEHYLGESETLRKELLGQPAPAGPG